MSTAGRRGAKGDGGGEVETADEASLEPYGLDASASRAPALLRYRTELVRVRSGTFTCFFVRTYVCMHVCMCVHDPVCRTRPRCKHFLL